MVESPSLSSSVDPISPHLSPSPPQPPFSLPPSTVPTSISLPPNPISSQPSIPFNRPWDRHLSSQTSSSGMAIGVPTPNMATAAFASLNPISFGQRLPSTNTTQVRPSIQGNQGMGMRGPVSSGPPMRAGGIAIQHQQRPVQAPVRPQTAPTNQSATSQNLQGHGMSRGQAVGSPGSPLPSISHGLQSHNQPWLSSGASPRPPLPNAPFRAQMNHPQSLQQRSHIPQQHRHPVSMPSPRPQPPPSQFLQQSSSTEVTQESIGQQIPIPRLSQQQSLKIPAIGNQKFVANSASQPSSISTGLPDKIASVEIVETCNRIISKRSIQELVAQSYDEYIILGQIDPNERLDSEVVDILVGIAEDFVESITSSACALAKHRKSTTLEPKDILLHLERNWNMSLPGFTGDEIKCFKKSSVNDIHKERLAVLRKSVATGDMIKSSTGQGAGSAKGHLAKTDVTQPWSFPNAKF